MLAGFSKYEIEIEPGLQLSGFISREEKSSEGIHDMLHIRVAVFEFNNNKTVVICYDTLALDWNFVEDIRNRISLVYSIAASSIILCATHTHSAPATVYLFRCGKVNKTYIEYLKAASINALQKAIDDMEEVSFGFETIRLKDNSYNRRRKLFDGRVVMNQFPSERVVKYGEIDESFSILKFQAAGKTKGIIMNFGAHACTVCELFITADYPGELCRLAEEEFGNNLVAIFWMGAAGNVNPIVSDFSYYEMKRNSSAIFEQIRNTLSAIETISVNSLNISNKKIDLTLNPILGIEDITKRKRLFEVIASGNTAKAEVLPMMKEILNILNMPPDRNVDDKKAAFLANAMVEYYNSVLTKINKGNVENTIPFEINVLQINDFKIVFLSAEIFAETALSIKRNFPNTMIVSMGAGSGNVGYLPTDEEYNNGGYEVDHAFKFYGLTSSLAKYNEQFMIQNINQILGDKN